MIEEEKDCEKCGGAGEWFNKYTGEFMSGLRCPWCEGTGIKKWNCPDCKDTGEDIDCDDSGQAIRVYCHCNNPFKKSE